MFPQVTIDNMNIEELSRYAEDDPRCAKRLAMMCTEAIEDQVSQVHRDCEEKISRIYAEHDSEKALLRAQLSQALKKNDK